MVAENRWQEVAGGGREGVVGGVLRGAADCTGQVQVHRQGTGRGSRRQSAVCPRSERVPGALLSAFRHFGVNTFVDSARLWWTQGDKLSHF